MYHYTSLQVTEWGVGGWYSIFLRQMSDDERQQPLHCQQSGTNYKNTFFFLKE